MSSNSWKSRYRNSFIGRAVRRLGVDERGAAAVEFAFIMPVMLTLYLGSMEASQGFDVNKRVGRSANMVADMISQQSTMTRSELAAISEIGESILLPYRRTSPDVEMVGIRITSDNPPRSIVEWSLKRSNGNSSRPYGVGTAIEVPTRLKRAGTFLVKAKVDLKYEPVTTWTLRKNGNNAGSFNMSRELFLRPRLVGVVECSDC